MLDVDKNGDGKQDTETYKYIYDVQNEKYYYDTAQNRFFRVVDGQKIYLDDDATIGEFGAKYRKVVIRISDINIDVYQLLNGSEATNTEWYVDKNGDGNLDERITETGGEITFIDGSKVDESVIWGKIGEISRTQDYSAMNYYIDAYDFTEWVKGNLSSNIESLDISNTNNPEDSNSAFAAERREVIKKAVQDTLDTSILQYTKETGQDGLEIIHIEETDWDEILRNATMISFFQGVPIGLKYYNNYAIATSTTNNEFINKNEIYFEVERRRELS